MAINPLKVYWLEMLYSQGHFNNKKSLFDLGPQDLTTSKDIIQKIVSHRIDKEHLNISLNNIFDGNDEPKSGFQKYFYQLFGFENYYSLDLNDSRADFTFDLNTPVNIKKKFDVITNFGTSEHIFNIGSFYKNIHHLLNVNGIALHINPSYGDINHGFFNIHPNVYSSLIKANAYEQISLLYIDNYVGRNEFLLKNTSYTPDFTDLDINLGNLENNFGDMKKLGSFRAKVYSTFINNSKSDIAKNYIRGNRGVFDYTFAALQKTSHNDFQMPQQYTSDATLLPN